MSEISQTLLPLPALRRRNLARAANGLWRWEPLLFALLIAAHLGPIWAFDYLPTTDGAAHVASADVLRKYGDPQLTVFRQYYYISATPTPNLVGHLLLAGLLYVVKPLVAEKLLVSLFIMLFPIALRYAVSSIRPRAAALAYLAFPMTYSFLLAQGFYNFCLSLAVLLLVIGFWIRAGERLLEDSESRRGGSAKMALILGQLLLLLYTCHLFSLAVACGVLALLAGGLVLDERGSRRRCALRISIATAAAMIPAVVLAAMFRPNTTGFESEGGAWSLKEDLASFLRFSTMVSYREAEAKLGGVLAALLLALILWAGINKIRRRCWNRWDTLALAPLGMFALYLKAHDGNSIHFYVPPRAMFLSYLLTIPWLAAQPFTARLRRILVPVAAGLSLAFLASHALKYRQFAPQLREFVSAGDRVARNSTFLPLVFAPQGRDAAGRPTSIDVAPFYMASGYIAVQRDAVDLRNYEAKTDHFPVRFRPELNPYTHLAIGKGLDSIPPRIDLAAFEKAGGRADYILIWGMNPEQRNLPETRPLIEQLERLYEPVELDARWTQLWKRRGL